MHQDVGEVDEEGDRQDQLQHVGEAHIRASHAVKANAAAKKITVNTIRVKSVMSGAPFP